MTVVGHNTTPQNWLVRWWLFSLIKWCLCHLLFNVRLFKTLSHDQHYWVWFVDINCRWPVSGNLIVGGPTNLKRGSETILKMVVRPNTKPQNQLMMWGLPPLINRCSSHLLSNVRLFNKSNNLTQIINQLYYRTNRLKEIEYDFWI
jgi:hypothetical protein